MRVRITNRNKLQNQPPSLLCYFVNYVRFSRWKHYDDFLGVEFFKFSQLHSSCVSTNEHFMNLGKYHVILSFRSGTRIHHIVILHLLPSLLCRSLFSLILCWALISGYICKTILVETEEKILVNKAILWLLYSSLHRHGQAVGLMHLKFN